jgi:hypothetical protein
MCSRKSLCRRIRRSSIPKSPTGAAIPSFRQWRADHAALSRSRQRHGGRTVQALIDVLEGNYGGDPTQMPYVVNKEAFEKT